jgi:cell wall-associated NlpC family hydrolase
VTTDPSAAIFAYNHLQSYVETVEYYAGVYAGGKFSVVSANLPAASSAAGCAGTAGVPAAVNAPNNAVATAIAFAEEQLGKPYQFGATGPDAFDCSGLVMMAYRSAGIDIPRTSQDQFTWGPHIQASQVEPGDLVFFVGADGTKTAPGHVGLVIGNGQMIDAPSAGIPIHIVSYSGMDPIGFTRPWKHAGVNLQAAAQSSG